MSAGFALLRRLLRETSGAAIEDDKRYFVEDRLQPVLRAAGMSGLDELAQALLVGRHSELARTVAETLTINETSFFRDRLLFSAMSDRVLPQLVAAREQTRRLRILCAGCSTGQEPYSVAMLLDEQMRRKPGWQIEILATDLSRPVIEQARRGTYSQFEVQRGLPVALLLRHFTRRGDNWQISDGMRAKVSFRTMNLLSPPADLGGFDIVFCRNVLFYFDAATKQRVLRTLADALAVDGFLALGGAERVGDLCPQLRPEPTAPFLFIRDVGRTAAADRVAPRLRAVS